MKVIGLTQEELKHNFVKDIVGYFIVQPLSVVFKRRLLIKNKFYFFEGACPEAAAGREQPIVNGSQSVL